MHGNGSGTCINGNGAFSGYTQITTVDNQQSKYAQQTAVSGSVSYGAIGIKIGGGSGHNHTFTQPTFTGTEATITTTPKYVQTYAWKRTA